MKISIRALAAACLVAMLSTLLLPAAAAACGHCAIVTGGGPFCRQCVDDTNPNTGCQQQAPCVCVLQQCAGARAASTTAAASFAEFLTGAALPAASLNSPAAAAAR